ncbi:hypothetical protein HDU76_004065 [Blyttiomyces sp. JEL0837]|nr:hypothetical protein HDU76_004065 [Blyttiomyces sp. JEL0837]
MDASSLVYDDTSDAFVSLKGRQLQSKSNMADDGSNQPSLPEKTVEQISLSVERWWWKKKPAELTEFTPDEHLKQQTRFQDDFFNASYVDQWNPGRISHRKLHEGQSSPSVFGKTLADEDLYNFGPVGPWTEGTRDVFSEFHRNKKPQSQAIIAVRSEQLCRASHSPSNHRMTLPKTHIIPKPKKKIAIVDKVSCEQSPPSLECYGFITPRSLPRKSDQEMHSFPKSDLSPPTPPIKQPNSESAAEPKRVVVGNASCLNDPSTKYSNSRQSLPSSPREQAQGNDTVRKELPMIPTAAIKGPNPASPQENSSGSVTSSPKELKGSSEGRRDSLAEGKAPSRTPAILSMKELKKIFPPLLHHYIHQKKIKDRDSKGKVTHGVPRRPKTQHRDFGDTGNETSLNSKPKVSAQYNHPLLTSEGIPKESKRDLLSLSLQNMHSVYPDFSSKPQTAAIRLPGLNSVESNQGFTDFNTKLERTISSSSYNGDFSFPDLSASPRRSSISSQKARIKRSAENNSSSTHRNRLASLSRKMHENIDSGNHMKIPLSLSSSLSLMKPMTAASPTESGATREPVNGKLLAEELWKVYSRGRDI